LPQPQSQGQPQPRAWLDRAEFDAMRESEARRAARISASLIQSVRDAIANPDGQWVRVRPWLRVQVAMTQGGSSITYVRAQGFRFSPVRDYDNTGVIRVDAIIAGRFYRIGYVGADNRFFPCASLGGPAVPVQEGAPVPAPAAQEPF